MFETTLPLTLNLTAAFGAYLIAGSLSGVLSGDSWIKILEDFRAHPGLSFVTGVFVFILGVTLVLVHQIWSDPLSILMSLVGWIAAVEGLVLIAVPNLLLGFALSMARPGLIKGFAIAIGILGIFLVFAGLTGRAG